jgi:hypothetical protein
MPTYMYPIKIKREAQEIRYFKEIELPDNSNGVLTLDQLRQFVTEDERFSISEKGRGLYLSYVLQIWGERLETAEELKTRIEEQEQYNIKQAEFQERHKRK